MPKRPLEAFHTASHAASLLRALVSVFVVSALIFSGLFWSPSGSSGQREALLAPISLESLDGLVIHRAKSFPGAKRYYSRYCGNYDYDAAWLALVPGDRARVVCFIYFEKDGELWLVQGDQLLPLSADLITLFLRVGGSNFFYFNCDEDVLRCQHPMVMPPGVAVDLDSRDNLTIEAADTENTDVEPEEFISLKSTISELPDLDWWVKLCHASNPSRYSDNCGDKDASPNNFTIYRPDYDTVNSFRLIWHSKTGDKIREKSFLNSVYLRDIATREPKEINCVSSQIDEASSVDNQAYTCYNHTLESDGNFIILASSSEAAKSGGAILNLSLPSVKVVAIEVTQGLQNWKNDLTLVKDRDTAVRVFLETMDGNREISGNLKATKIIGEYEEEFVDSQPPRNPDGTVIVRPNVTERRKEISSSLNFLLPKTWTQLQKGEKLKLELEFTDDPDICNKNSEIDLNICTATVEFTEIVTPNIYMFPIPYDKGDEEDDDIPSKEQLMEQFHRVKSVLPLSNIQFIDTIENHNYTYELIKKNIETELLEPEEKGYIVDVYRAIWYVNNHADVKNIYVGIMETKKVTGRAGVGGPRLGEPAVWFISESDKADTLGQVRNLGAHEIGHALGEPHSINAEKRIVCREDLPPEEVIEEVELRRQIYPHIYVLKGSYREDKPVATLGPVDAQDPDDNSDIDASDEEEVWGLDLRFVDSSQFIGGQVSDSLVIPNPYEVFSIMSYCLDRNSNNQTLWVDEFHYERIIATLKKKNTILNRIAVDENTPLSRVPSILFSGTISFSSNTINPSVDLNSAFLRRRQTRTSIEEGNYTLEFRDNFDNVLRSVKFQATEPQVLFFDSEETAENKPNQEIHRKALFGFQVENPPEYTTLAILLEGKEIAVFEGSQYTPELSIVTGPNLNQAYDSASIMNISWESNDADNDDLIYSVYYSTDAGINYNPLRLDTSQTSINLNVSQLRGSQQARIGVSVSDGLRSSFAETPVFSVPGHTPEVYIETPESGFVFEKPQVITLYASGNDKDDDTPLKFRWRNDLNEDLGTENNLLLFSTDLGTGEHTITVTATDNDGMTATASVDIVVTDQITLPQPVNDYAFSTIDQTIPIDVLTNDIDTAGVLNQTTLSVSSSPSLGTARVFILPQGYPLLEYTASSQGQDTLAYSVCDINYNCYTAQVTVIVDLPNCTVLGTDGNDILTGTSEDDVICGLGGDDTIDAKGGDDIIHAGPGDDTIYARVGDDIIYGGDGDDFILAHRGDDLIYGGKGSDTIYAGGGNDIITGGTGADKIYGEADNDNLFGDNGPDIIHGGRGDDTIYGGEGDDMIRGNDGSDTIYSGDGQDTILGVTPLDIVRKDR